MSVNGLTSCRPPGTIDLNQLAFRKESSMRKPLIVLGWFLSIHLIVVSASFAQGKSATQGRGLANAAQRASAAAASGLQTANAAKMAADSAQHTSGKTFGSDDHDVAKHGINRDLGAGIRRAFGAQRRSDQTARQADLIAERTVESEDSSPTLETLDRIRQQRLDRAAHLREISEQNGNEALLDTADRMEASAERNYLRQTDSLSSPPTGEVQPDESPEVGDMPEEVTERVVLKRRRGFWIRSR
jgi:hypothetical protein